ncbi:MAG: hypothetical protein ACRD2P_13680, partial [Terriglobia bacterium]
VATLSFSFVFARVVSGSGDSAASGKPDALDRAESALKLAMPARALPVAWMACRLVILLFAEFDISWRLLFGSKTA